MYTRVATSDGLWEKSDDLEGRQSVDTVPPHIPNRRTWPLVHIYFLLTYTIIFVIAFRMTSESNIHGPGLINSPAHPALRYEKILFDDDLTKLNPYRGPPRPELDKAWSDLVKYSNIRVAGSALKAISRKSVQLSDGSGMYMAELNVHHQLHCLKVIRQSFHPEYYDLPQRHMSEHMDHCLDNLRLLIMCKADVSLQTYDWLDNNRRPFANFRIEHECFNWDSVNDWAKEHSFDLYDNRTLMHPTLGVSFPVDKNGALMMGMDMDPLEGRIITPDIE